MMQGLLGAWLEIELDKRSILKESMNQFPFDRRLFHYQPLLTLLSDHNSCVLSMHNSVVGSAKKSGECERRQRKWKRKEESERVMFVK